jgi:MFS family permease
MDEKPTKLFNKNYLLLWQGQTVSRLGSSLFLLPMMLWVKDTTGSAAIMGLLLSIASIPGLILGPIGGTFADRYSRKKIIVYSDLFRGVLVLGVTGLLFFTPASTNIILGALFVMALVNAVLLTVFGPAITASIPDLVPKKAVAGANSLGQVSMLLSNFLGQGLGGVLYRLIGAPLVFFINSLSFFYAAGSDALVTIPQKMPEKSLHWKEEFKSFYNDVVFGFKYVFERKGLRDTVIISAVLGFFTAPIMILMPFFVDDYLHLSEDWYGYLVAVYFLGTFIGSIFAGAVHLPPNVRGKIILISIIIQSVGYALFGLVRDQYLAMVLAMLNGIVQGYITINIITIVQITTSGDIRGRIVAILSTISNILVPFAALLVGVLIDLVNQRVEIIFIVSGAIMTIFIIVLSFNPYFRQFLASDIKDVPDTIDEQVEV